MCREVSVLSVPYPIDVSCDIVYYLFSDRFLFDTGDSNCDTIARSDLL